jgi:hypothetical protein
MYLWLGFKTNVATEKGRVPQGIVRLGFFDGNGEHVTDQALLVGLAAAALISFGLYLQRRLSRGRRRVLFD